MGVEEGVVNEEDEVVSENHCFEQLENGIARLRRWLKTVRGQLQPCQHLHDPIVEHESRLEFRKQEPCSMRGESRRCLVLPR